mgnify:CR=1 FL=1
MENRLGAAAAAIVLLGTSAGAAQEAEAPITETAGAPAEETKDQIIVYGDKRGRGLSDTEASVLIHTGAEIEASTMTDLYDVIEQTPNVNSTYNDKGFSIRGIAQGGISGGDGGTGLLLSVIVDNVALPTSQSAFFGPYSAWDVGQVEVFRGGVGTKQGRNALAGAIIIRSADPSHEWEAKARASYGELNTGQLSGAVNMPIIEDKIALRLSADYTFSDGWVENPVRDEDDFDARHMLTLRGKMLYDISSDTSAILSVSYTDSKAGEDTVLESRFPDERINLSDLKSEEGGEHKIASLELTHRFSDGLTLTSITSGSFHDYVRIEDVDQSADPGNEFEIYREDWTVAQEVRASFQYGRFSGVAGLYGTLIRSDQHDTIGAPATLVLDSLIPAIPVIGGLLTPALELLLADVSVARVSATQDDVWNVAAFGEVDFAVTDRLTLTAGARYDYEHIEGTYNDNTSLAVLGIPFNLPPGVTIPGVPIGVSSNDSGTSFDAFLPKAALSYEWSDQLTTILSAQRGYRAGGRSRAYIQGEVADYGPEYTWTYELAVRTRFGASAVNANLFYIDWTDQQVGQQLSGSSADTITVNAGHSRLWGIEADARIAITDSVSAHVAFGYVNSEFLDFNTSGTDLSGNEFPYASRISASWGLSYEAPFGLVARTDMSFKTGTWSAPENDPAFKTDPVFLIDVKLGYAAQNWSVMGYARNLLNNDYRNNRFYFIDNFARTGAPRIAGVELNARL